MLPTPQNGQTSCSENILEIVNFFFCRNFSFVDIYSKGNL